MIHRNLKRYRLRRKWTQTKLAAEIGTTTQSVQRWERREVEMKASTITRVCTALNITPNELFGIGDRAEIKPDKINRMRRLVDKLEDELWSK